MLRKLEKYELIDEIGHGGMATVYRARDSRLDRPVAVKVMHPHLRAAQEARARFTREARSVARLKHPNILEIYDNSEEDSDESYIVTELLSGPTLKRFAETHDPIPAEVAACFTIQIASALACAHEAGIVHRDVKPENVLLHDDRTIKLTDFGIAQMMDAQSFTATGQILGSPGHMAPEQVEGGECDARTDVFSLGTVFYFLATGRLPFQGKNPHQILRRIMESDYPDPIRVRPAVGGRVTKIIERALAKDPAQRYADAQDFEAALRDFVEEMGIEEPAEMLARYLADPEGVREALRESSIERLTDLGQRAAQRRDVATALMHFNRVLGIDEGNERVLALIEKVGTRTRQRNMLAAMGVALGVFGVAAFGYAALGPNGGAGAGDVIADGDPTGEGTGEIGPDPPAAADAGARGTAADAAEPTRADAGRSVSVTAMAHAPVGPVRSRAPRRVLFDLLARSMRVSIDDGPPQSVNTPLELPPGVHSFRFAGDCCDEARVTQRIPPGPGTISIRPTISYHPARLYVASNQPGDVMVRSGTTTVRGRTRNFLSVPVEAPRVRASVTVTAEGFREYRGVVVLDPGAQTELTVTLQEVAGSDP